MPAKIRVYLDDIHRRPLFRKLSKLGVGVRIYPKYIYFWSVIKHKHLSQMKEFQIIRSGNGKSAVVVATEATYMEAAKRRRELQSINPFGFKYRVKEVPATNPTL